MNPSSADIELTDDNLSSIESIWIPEIKKLIARHGDDIDTVEKGVTSLARSKLTDPETILTAVEHLSAQFISSSQSTRFINMWCKLLLDNVDVGKKIVKTGTEVSDLTKTVVNRLMNKQTSETVKETKKSLLSCCGEPKSNPKPTSKPAPKKTYKTELRTSPKNLKNTNKPEFEPNPVPKKPIDNIDENMEDDVKANVPFS